MPEPSPSDTVLFEQEGAGVLLAQPPPDATASDVAETSPQGATGAAEGYKKRRLGLVFWIAAGWMVTLVLLAILAPWLTSKGILKDPNLIDLKPGRTFAKMSSKDRLGTDLLGRDQLSRLIWAARVSLPVGFASIGLGLMLGTTIGLVAGYLKGKWDTWLMGFMDVMLAFPALLLALSIVAFLDRKELPTISLAIGIIAVPGLARLVRANTLTFSEREFVLAARTLGASHGRIIVKEILPNVIPPVLSFAVIGVAVAIAAEAALAYVGVSVPLPTATWGGMIVAARDDLATHPFQVFLPCGVLVITIVALYFIGDRLGQFFNVKESAL
jgi:peptide/nickel transport system permease protein